MRKDDRIYDGKIQISEKKKQIESHRATVAGFWFEKSGPTNRAIIAR
jgi:hypothetical protein